MKRERDRRMRERNRRKKRPKVRNQTDLEKSQRVVQIVQLLVYNQKQRTLQVLSQQKEMRKPKVMNQDYRSKTLNPRERRTRRIRNESIMSLLNSHLYVLL